MKKAKQFLGALLSFVLVLMLVFSLAACSSSECKHADSDSNGKCDSCGVAFQAYNPGCNHVDVDKNAECDKCGEPVECNVHIDADKNAECDVCGKTVSCTNHIDIDKNAKCDVCGKTLKCSSHIDTNKNAKCDICGATLACNAHIDVNRDSKCDICKETVACNTHVDSNKDSKCDACGLRLTCSAHIDADKDSLCDICGERVNCISHIDTDKNAVCDACGERLSCSIHIDTDKNAICDVCGLGIDCSSHVDANKDSLCDVCGESVKCTVHIDLSPRDARCDICGEKVECTVHVDTNKDAKCDVCNTKLDCNSHKDISPKDNRCDICGAAFVCVTHIDANKNYICDRCGEAIPCSSHTDADGNTKCDNCGADVACTSHIDNDMNAKCDICGTFVPCESHSDINSDYICDVCDKILPCPIHTDENEDFICDVCGERIPCDVHVDASPKDAICDICGEEVPCKAHVDSDKNLKCDVCGKDVACDAHVDEYPKDSVCDVCGQKVPCVEHVDEEPKNAVCDVCGESLPCDHTDSDRNGECDVCGATVPIEKIQLALIQDGTPNFQFVLGKSATGDTRKKVEGTIVRTLKNDFNIDVAVVTEGYANDSEMDIEVLVGDVQNRGAEYQYDRYSLGKKGYIIKIVGNKILINAGSDATLLKALDEFSTEILGIDSDDVFDAVMTEDDSVEKIQDDYKITSLSVNGGNMKGYTIATDKSSELYLKTAESVQDIIYERTGYWFPIVSLEDAGDNSVIIRHKSRVYSDESFAIDAVGASLIIECAFDNKLSDAISAFITGYITLGSGDIDFTGDVYNRDISVVYYEDFGAVGDGKTDDFAAIYKAHEFANECGQLVKAKAFAKYYIHNTYMEELKRVSPIPIKTNVDWTGAEFIIDDSDIHYINNKSMATENVFAVLSDYKKITVTDKETLNAIGSVGEAYGTTKLDLGLGYPAMLIIYNDNHSVYRRSSSGSLDSKTGENSSDVQHELILVDANGNIDSSTPFMFDYTQITKIEVIRTDIEPITIKGGTITTIACGLDAYYKEGTSTKKFGYYDRGIMINRSHTTLDGVKHLVTGEITVEMQGQGIEGAHYRGMFHSQGATDITFENCQFQGRRYYGLAGTYDIYGDLVNNITFENCTQNNFWIDELGNPSDKDKGDLSMRWDYFDTSAAYSSKIRHCWGIGGTNFSKNMTYRNSQLSRFDSHCGLYNGTIENCEITAMYITGKGKFTVRDTVWYAAGESATDNSLIYMRSDYGSTWEGDVILDNVTAYVNPDGKFYMFYHSYTNWDYGYKCYIPNINISNLSLYNLKTKRALADETEITFFYGDKDNYMHLDKTYSTNPRVIMKNDATGLYYIAVDAGADLRNDNPIGMPDYIKITNNTHNYKFRFVKNSDPNFYFADTKFYYSDTEYYQGTNHSNTNTFVFK